MTPDAIFPEIPARTSLSYPLSARRYPEEIPSTSLHACEQSATVPAIPDILPDIPCVFTTRCALTLSSLLFAHVWFVSHAPQRADVPDMVGGRSFTGAPTKYLGNSIRKMPIITCPHTTRALASGRCGPQALSNMPWRRVRPRVPPCFREKSRVPQKQAYRWHSPAMLSKFCIYFSSPDFILLNTSLSLGKFSEKAFAMKFLCGILYPGILLIFALVK